MANFGRRAGQGLHLPGEFRPVRPFMDIRHNHRTSCGDYALFSPQRQYAKQARPRPGRGPKTSGTPEPDRGDGGRDRHPRGGKFHRKFRRVGPGEPCPIFDKNRPASYDLRLCIFNPGAYPTFDKTLRPTAEKRPAAGRRVRPRLIREFFAFDRS
jgi:hypothetical protein